MGRIRRQVEDRMPRFTDILSDGFAFVKGGIVHDDNGSCRELWDKIVGEPQRKDLFCDTGLCCADGQQNPG